MEWSKYLKLMLKNTWHEIMDNEAINEKRYEALIRLQRLLEKWLKSVKKGRRLYWWNHWERIESSGERDPRTGMTVLNEEY